MKTVFSQLLICLCSLLPLASTAAQKNKVTKTKAPVKEAWSHDDLITYLKDHPEKMDLETVSTIRAENAKFSEADKVVLYTKYLSGLRGGAFHHYYHFWDFFHTDLSKSAQAELAAMIIKETGKNFNEHSREIDFDSCSYFLPYLVEGAKDWFTPNVSRDARIDSTRSMQLWGVVKLMERNTGWLFAHVGDFSFGKDLMAECDSFRQFNIPYTYDLNPELTAKKNNALGDKYLDIPALSPQPLGAALNIYQLVLNYYSSDTLLRDRLILADLMRLQFVNTCFSGPSAKTAWREAIQRLLVHNGNNPSSTLVAAQLANYLYKLSKENESPEQGSAASWYRFQAYHTAKQFSTRFPDGLGAKACRMLMHDVAQSNFSAELDQQWYPNMPTLLKLKYKNMRQLYVYVFDLKNPKDTAASPEPGTLLKLQKVPLKDFGDFYEHRTQIAIEGLNAGKYYVELSDTVLTYDDAARLAAYIVVAPLRITYFTNAKGKQEALAIDIKTGEKVKCKNFNLDTYQHFPVPLANSSKGKLVGAITEINKPNEAELKNVKHQLPAPTLTLNKGAYQPGDMVECVAKIGAKEYAQYLHLGGFYAQLLNAGQEINVRDFKLDDNESVRKLYWFNEDHQFVLRFHLDSVLRDGDYLLQVGDASVQIPVRNNFDQGTFSIQGPLKANFGDRMHFTAKWKPGIAQHYTPSHAEVSVALLEYDFGKAGLNRHVSNQSLKLDAQGNFTFDYVPVLQATADENNNMHYLARYTFTWSFLDSSGHAQIQYNRYYISYPDLTLVSEVPSIVEENGLLESMPILKAIEADGALADKYPCKARLIRLRQPIITPVVSNFTPDYFTLPVDSFRNKFPHFTYAGETDINNFTTRDTVLNVEAINTDALDNALFPPMDNGAYMLELASNDPRLKTTINRHRFEYINATDSKNPSPEWLSVTYHYSAPYVSCAEKAKSIQVYYYGEKGMLKHAAIKSSAKWTKLKCPSGTRSIVLETYVDGKHIVRTWAYPQIEELL